MMSYRQWSPRTMARSYRIHNQRLESSNDPYVFRIQNNRAPNMTSKPVETTSPSKPKEESKANDMIPGLSRVISSAKPLWYRGVWCLILIIATLICIYQVSDRIALYLKKQTIYQSQVKINDTVSLPAITICAEDAYGSLKLKKEYAKEKGIANECTVHWTDLIGYKGMDVEQVWRSYTTKDYLEEYKLREAIIVSKEDEAKTKPLPTILGYCETLDFSDIVYKYEYGYITYMRLILQKVNASCGYSGIKIRVHSTEDSLRHLISRQSLHLFRGIMADLLVDYHRIIQMSTSEDPCWDRKKHDDCLDKCLDAKITQGLNCRLPFMNSKLPFCKNKEDAKKAFEHAEHIYAGNPDCSHCVKKCIEDKYSGIISPYGTGAENIEMGIYYNTNMFQTATEVYAYDIISCLCEIGGNLGLFLGLCIIHLLELLDSYLVVNLMRKWKIDTK